MTTIRPGDYEVLDPQFQAILKDRMDNAPFPRFLGLRLEEVRRDYARMRLPYRPELNQPAGIVHGGAIVSLIDTVVVTAIISGLGQPPEKLLTIDLHTHFINMVREEDCVAEAVIRHRGRKIVFMNVEVRTASGILAADASLSYKVVLPRTP